MGDNDPLDYAREFSLKGGTKKNAMRRTKTKTQNSDKLTGKEQLNIQAMITWMENRENVKRCTKRWTN